MRGKYLIITVLVIALAAATFAWSVQFFRGRRVLELWGSEAAMLIRLEADDIKLFLLQPAPTGEESDVLQIDGQEFEIAKRIDLEKARGLIHARQALIDDGSFAWNASREGCQPQWPYALRFAKGTSFVTIAIDTKCQRARMLETGREASIAPIAAGLQTFIDEQLPSEKEEKPQEEFHS